MPYTESVPSAVGEQTTVRRYVAYRGGYDRYTLVINGGVPDADLSMIDLPYAASVEGFMAQRTDELLETAEKPVVVMDIGAASAVTLMRLGRDRATAVEQGRLALIATNLNTTVSSFIGGLPDAERDYAEDLYANAGHLLHEISTDFMPGRSYDIQLPNGERLDLTRNVDVAHERLSLTAWGRSLDLQIPEVGKLISARGIYMVRMTDLTYRQPGRVKRSLDEDGLTKAIITLNQRDGLEPVGECQAGRHAGALLRYMIFKGADAAPIDVKADDITWSIKRQ